VVSNNMVVGGQMGQGKSNACRVVMLGAALIIERTRATCWQTSSASGPRWPS